MDFANEADIQCWVLRYAGHPILSCAANTLYSLMEGVNGCSDGWPYWAAPRKSAQKLISLLSDADRELRRGEEPDIGDADLALAYRPIKAFRTRYATKYGFDVELHYPVVDDPSPAGKPLTLFV